VVSALQLKPVSGVYITRKLLPVTRFVLRAGFVLNLALTPFLALMLVTTFFAGPEGAEAMMRARGADSSINVVLAYRVFLAGGVVLMILFALLLRSLLRIIDSARDGDPFIPANAARLRHIGWLLLAILVLEFLISLPLGPGPAAGSFGSIVPGLVIVLLVFVLARVFEIGSTMRTELKETV
jgi:hypothetical protein